MKLPVWPKDERDIIDEDGAFVCFANTTEDRDYIIKAINSHEKLANALNVIKQGVLELSDNLDNTEYSGENAAQEHDRQQWRGERIMNERVLKLIEQALKEAENKQ